MPIRYSALQKFSVRVPDGRRESCYEDQQRWKNAVAKVMRPCDHRLEGRYIIRRDESRFYKVFDAVTQSGIDDHLGNDQQRYRYEETNCGRKIKEKGNLDVGVQGKYDDLRAFINDIEHSKNFLVLNAIQLQGIEPQNVQRPGGVRTVTRGQKVVGPIEVIALRLKLDAYFKR